MALTYHHVLQDPRHIGTSTDICTTMMLSLAAKLCVAGMSTGRVAVDPSIRESRGSHRCLCNCLDHAGGTGVLGSCGHRRTLHTAALVMTPLSTAAVQSSPAALEYDSATAYTFNKRQSTPPRSGHGAAASPLRDHRSQRSVVDSTGNAAARVSHNATCQMQNIIIHRRQSLQAGTERVAREMRRDAAD